MLFIDFVTLGKLLNLLALASSYVEIKIRVLRVNFLLVRLIVDVKCSDQCPASSIVSHIFPTHILITEFNYYCLLSLISSQLVNFTTIPFPDHSKIS